MFRLVRGGERVSDRDEHDGARAGRAELRAQTRNLRAQLVDGRVREDEVVRVGQRVGVAPPALEALREPEAAAELSQVPRAAELEEEGGVVRRVVGVVEARGEGGRVKRGRDSFDEGRELGGRVRRRGLRLEASPGERRRERERERRVAFDGDERVHKRRVEHVVALVGGEEVCAAAAVVSGRAEDDCGQAQGAAEREGRAVLLERQSREPAPVVVPGVRVEALVAEEV